MRELLHQPEAPAMDKRISDSTRVPRGRFGLVVRHTLIFGWS